MKIHSKFKDYYDHVLAYGQDEDVSYIRNTEIYCCPSGFYNGNFWTHNHKWFKFEQVNGKGVLNEHRMLHPIGAKWPFITILFCGKVYNAIKVDQKVIDGEIVPAQFFYDADKYARYLEMIKPVRADKYYLPSDILRVLSRNGVETNLNRTARCPVIMVADHYGDFVSLDMRQYLPYGHGTTYNVYNPKLYEVQFQKMIDPYTAYMELDMFISGVLGKTGGEMVTISDKDKVDKHGFDSKYGFRKRPGEKV
ncbi:hypothetical protein E6Q11_02135 [Candidatus Dojkabacteria bacterium]|uniref:Uncharacterized protein n=1 Tax=Candidatus Dojkabacteria bacterium TaxID=2099670 RepID=A0A5C7J9P2_9BACT|nr:MAG: hypothetical protein E6Q11_02135 [Candidatus Dojkabacteria bacterium]